MTGVSSDLSDLIAGTQIATIFLDNTLRIERFSPTAAEVFRLVKTDAGRPISDIVSKLEYPELVHDTGEVLGTLVPREKTSGGGNGRWYLVRILPYRATANVIDGVVITFVDISEQKETGSENCSSGSCRRIRNSLIIRSSMSYPVSGDERSC